MDKILAKNVRMCYTENMIRLEKFFGKKICVATSGGVDSTSLLHYLKNGREKYGYILSVVHCEHGIRGAESLADGEFVRELCQQWELPLYYYSEDCPQRALKEKVSLETAARNFRKECFSKLIEGGEADYIATAHHMDDEAETVLFRLARGASLSGMKGMTSEDGYIIRPFLDWSRKDIQAYAEKNGLAYREDSTNKELDATRNKLRLEILPKLENAVFGAAKNIVRFSKLAAEDDDWLYAKAFALISEQVDLDGDSEILVEFSCEKPLFRRAALTAMKRLGVEKDYTATHLEDVFYLQSLERGARVSLPRGVEAEKGEKGILFRKEKEPLFSVEKKSAPFQEGVFDGGRYAVNVSNAPIKADGLWKILRVDSEKIPENAVFRFRKEGDKIERFGGGTKSLKKFFNEEKISVREREWLPLIAEADENEVYAVCGVEISEKIKTDKNTEKVLYIMLQKKKEK